MTGTSYTSSIRCSLLLVTVSSLARLVSSEIRSFSGIIEAASTVVHYSEGFLIAPAYIDISDLDFQTIDDGDTNYVPTERPSDDGTTNGDKRSPDEVDDDKVNGETPTKVTNPPAASGGGRERRILADDTSSAGTTIDIVFLYEPDECSNSRTGCDWTKLGVGARDDKGIIYRCCSPDAIDNGFCQEGKNGYGRLIVNSTTFKGQHRFLTVPSSGKLQTKVKYGTFEEPTNSGKYVLIIANCNDNGRDVLVSGHYTWYSKHGYLPGNLFGEMFFFVFVTFIFLVITLWYGISIKVYEDESIPIQKWIFGTIFLGLLEGFFRTGDFFVWNEDGTRFWFAMYTGVIIGVMKRAISRCLIVMVSLGWGVVRDSLGTTMRTIITLGIIYVGTSTARDIMTLFVVTENETISAREGVELFDAVTILTFVVAAVDVTFYLWILDSLNGTMQYLENMNQASKLMRYLRLRLILLLSILFAVVWSVFSIVNSAADESILQEQNAWIIDAAMEINYLMVLIAVSVLWRPNPNARQYAYVTELPSIGGDDGEDDLEMTGNIPSALDDDDDDDDEDIPGAPTKSGGYSDEPDDKFQVNGAVHT